MSQPIDPRFPEPLQELWATLSADVVWLHGRWIIYRQLFGTSQRRIDILNEASGTITWILQQLLLHDVQITLSKISDPPGSGDRTNLTLRRLQNDIRKLGDVSVADALDSPLTQFEAACEKVRHRRNKWIAHNDLTTRLQARVEPLSGPSRQEIEDALAPLRAAMHVVELHYANVRTVYEHFVMKQDGNHLLYALLQGKRYSELVKDGTIPRDDFSKRFPDGPDGA